MKYIIDIEDEYTKDWVNETPMCKELCIPISVPNRQRTYHVITGFKLEPYTEPDRKAIEDEVWKNTWKMFLTPEDFGATMGDSYQEAKSKFEEWKKRKDDVRVGDEVIYHRNKYIVGYVGEDEVYHLVDQCWLRVVVQGNYQLTKTGRHFDEVAELMKKMKEESK